MKAFTLISRTPSEVISLMTITGSGEDNVIEGGAGGDTLSGGAGDNDTLSYENSNRRVRIDLERQMICSWWSCNG